MILTLVAAACTDPEPAATTREPLSATNVTPAVSPSSNVPEPQLPEHRIQVHVVDGVGEFYDTATGDEFVARGMNYNRFLPGVTGPVFDSVLSTRTYDPVTVDTDLAAMADLGFNVVRIMMETCGVYADGCITGSDGRLNPDYLDNLVDFLHRAKAKGLFVMIASNTLPDESYWLDATSALVDATFESANNEFLNPKAVPLYVEYWESVVQALVDRDAPLDAIWAYELRQEHHFHLNYAPLNLNSGVVTTANGQSYDMADREQKIAMVDQGVTYWADLIRTAIRGIDPTALVTVGFFTPNQPNMVQGPNEARYVSTGYFIRNSTMDFFDLHHYPGNGVDDAEVWENFGIAGAEGKPIVLGEYGGYKAWYSDGARAAAAVMGMEVGSCRVGFDGWVVWAWRGDQATDIWWATEGDGEIAEVVAPVNRPDPCDYADFDFIRYNAAVDATATVSSAVEGAPADHAIDGTLTLWNAEGFAPQWIELALAQPTEISEVRLVVAQDPPGRSVHELWVRTSGGELQLVQTFDGVTGNEEVLVYKPSDPIPEVDLVRVVTTFLIDLAPAWFEIELLSTSPPD